MFKKILLLNFLIVFSCSDVLFASQPKDFGEYMTDGCAPVAGALFFIVTLVLIVPGYSDYQNKMIQIQENHSNSCNRTNGLFLDIVNGNCPNLQHQVCLLNTSSRRHSVDGFNKGLCKLQQKTKKNKAGYLQLQKKTKKIRAF